MSGRLIVVAPAATIAVRQTVATNSGSERVASSHENSTSSTPRAARVTDDVAAATTSSGVRRSFFSMCSALVARKMWMRERGASASAADAASMSAALARQSEATVTFSAARATARTPSKSPGDEAAKPASITSTPEPLELVADLHLLVRPQRDSRRLLAVPKGGVEDRDPARAQSCSSLIRPPGS